MSENKNRQPLSPENADKPAQAAPAREAEPSSPEEKAGRFARILSFPGKALKRISDKLDSAIPESKFKRDFKKAWAALGLFPVSSDGEEETEPPPPPERPLKDAVREFIGRCRDREKRNAMLKEFGGWAWKMFFRGMVYLFLFVLTVWGTIRVLDFSETLRIGFYPSDDVMDYLAAEHETLEAAAARMTPPDGKKDGIPLDSFDAKCRETVKPIRIYADEYGVYLMTSKGWYNGEHGIFIAKDEENMPPDINWGLIEGRIYTYAIYD